MSFEMQISQKDNGNEIQESTRDSTRIAAMRTEIVKCTSELSTDFADTLDVGCVKLSSASKKGAWEPLGTSLHEKYLFLTAP